MQFEIDEKTCIRCGLCAKDCPASIISMKSGFPTIADDKAGNCIGCQHCLTICPTGALSVLGHRPEDCRVLKNNLPDAEQLAMLMKGRRSIRQYKDENLEPELIQQLLDVAGHAPTGVNAEQVRFSLIGDKSDLAVFREEVYSELAAMAERGELLERKAKFGKFAELWQTKGIDILFRNAPHLLVTSAPKNCPTPVADCLIALTYFELYAQSMGVGTLWNGFTLWTIDSLVPALRKRLGIPEDHQVGFVISFGKPAVSYQRTVEKGAANVVHFKP